MTSRSLAVVACASAALAVASSAAGAPQPGSKARPVRAQANPLGGFLPGRVVVHPRALVYFRNTDKLMHNVVSEREVAGRPAFTSGRPTARNFRLVAPKRPGTYRYFCGVHGFMTGTLVVRR